MSNLMEAIEQLKLGAKLYSNGKVTFTRSSVCELLEIPASELCGRTWSQGLVYHLVGVGLEAEYLNPSEELSEAMVGCILFYYAVEAPEPSEVARQILSVMVPIGFRAAFQELTAPTPEPEPETELQRLQRAIEETQRWIDEHS